MNERNIGFIQGVAYAAGLVRRYGSDSDQIIGESGITKEELMEYCDEYDLENLGLINEDEPED